MSRTHIDDIDVGKNKILRSARFRLFFGKPQGLREFTISDDSSLGPMDPTCSIDHRWNMQSMEVFRRTMFRPFDLLCRILHVHAGKSNRLWPPVERFVRCFFMVLVHFFLLKIFKKRRVFVHLDGGFVC